MTLGSFHSLDIAAHVKMLIEKLDTLDASMYNRLILLVGPSKSGKTSILKKLYALDTGRFGYCNLGLSVSKRLVNLTVQERRLDLMSILLSIVSEYWAETLLIDNTELLFDPQLSIDPLRCFTTISREKTIIAAWNGVYDFTKPSLSNSDAERLTKTRMVLVPFLLGFFWKKKYLYIQVGI